MKKLILTIFLLAICLTSLFAQENEPKLTLAEKRQAQRLAARFYNRLAQTQDFKPLIKQYFISGFAKWYKDALIAEDSSDPEIPKDATEKDVLRYYTDLMNHFYLYYNSVNLVQIIHPELNPKGIIEITGASEIVKDAIKKQLKIDRLQIESEDFDPINFISSSSKTSMGFRNSLAKVEKLITTLKKVEAKFRLETKKKVPRKRLTFLPKDFEITVSEEDEFKYPKAKKFIMVLIKELESTHIPCVMMLVKEKNQLKVLTVFPPPQ